MQRRIKKNIRWSRIRLLAKYKQGEKIKWIISEF